MARFGQGFINSLVNPGYGQGLFTAAQTIGGTQGRMRQQEEQSQARQLINEAIASNDPTKIMQASQAVSTTMPEMSTQLAQIASQLSSKNKETQMAALEQGGQEITAQAQRARAAQMARQRKDREAAQAILSGLMDPQEYVAKIAGPKEPQKPLILSAGAAAVDPVTGEIIAERGYKPEAEETININEIIKSAKYTPESVARFEATGNISELQFKPESVTQAAGELSPNAEKRFYKIDEEAQKAGVQLNSNRRLQSQLLANPNKTSGIASEWRSSVLSLAGMQDEEEEAKVAFLRNRNTQIVSDLPPGAASDRDIQVFSAGFPSENANTETLVRYLQAEERILAAQQDLSYLADKHLQEQVNAGSERASFLGFTDAKARYGRVMALAEKRIEAAKQQNDEEAVQREIQMLNEALGFTPTIYR